MVPSFSVGGPGDEAVPFFEMLPQIEVSEFDQGFERSTVLTVVADNCSRQINIIHNREEWLQKQQEEFKAR